jgi:hypothetical protein
MNLLTPIAGFLIGYGGIMGYQVIDSTYKGEMPGPKSFGYFIGGMTLLSAATIYALGRTDKVFNAEGDSCQNCESPSPIQTTPLLDKWGEISEYKFCGAGCEGQYMRENKMLKAGFSWQGRRRKDEYEAQGLSQFTPNELTQSSAIHGDFDHASLNYSGHQNMILSAEGNYNDFIEDMEGVIGKYGEMKDFDSGYNPQDNLLKARMVVEVDDEDFDNVEFDAETMMPEKQCVICGGPYIGYGHNPEPIFPMSRGRCCDVCNATVVIPYRLGGMNFRFGEDFESETTRKFRNRFEIKERGNRRSRAATGVKRNIWKNFFRKDAENMSDELDMVMAQLYEIEDMKNPTPEDLTNYQNLLTRYYEVVRFNAEQKTARVRTMSGKPVSETLRKLKQDKNLSAKDARTRKEIKAENMEVFEAPKTKKGFNWVDLDDENAEHPRETLTKSVKKAKQDGWKQVSWMQSGGKREKQIWGKMAQSPQWNAWVKDFTARCKSEGSIMSETYMVFNGTAYWKDTYDPDHMGEEGEWAILTKDNKVLLFYYYSDWENNTTVMRKTFTVPTKPVAKAKPKPKARAKRTTTKPKAKVAKKTTTRKAKPKAKAKTGRKAPTISATRRKIGTRMRGNDGKMWEVKKSGKSQRWIAGAETLQ